MKVKTCRRCHGTGVEPNSNSDNYVYENGRPYRLHPTKICPICGARLMLGWPSGGHWHCSALPTKAPDWMEHYKASLVIQAKATQQQEGN